MIKTIEEHEKAAKAKDKSHQTFHLCIVNLVIGTLYCSKDMYSFGLKLVIESLKPMNEKLGTDTWYYTKRCLLSYIEKAMKKLTSIDENLYDHLIDFLDSAYQEGKNITTIIYVEKSERHKSTVAYEAKFLKKIFLKLPPNKNKELHLK